MSHLSFKAPLNWPEAMLATPRNQQRGDHGFPALSLMESIQYLDSELADMTITSAVLFSDIEQPLIERLRKKVGSHTGACLHFKYSGRAYVLACDRWQLLEHNIYALHLTLRQWRSIERWGIGNLSTLLAGFEVDRMPDAAEGQTGVAEPWMEALGLGPTATLDDAVAVYHRRAKTVAHDSEELAKLNSLMEEARGYFRRNAS